MREPHAAKRLAQAVELGSALTQKKRRQQRVAPRSTGAAAFGGSRKVGEQPAAGAPSKCVAPVDERRAYIGPRGPDPQKIAVGDAQHPRLPERTGVAPVVELAGVAWGRGRPQPPRALHRCTRGEGRDGLVHAHQQVAANRGLGSVARENRLDPQGEVHRRRPVIEAAHRAGGTVAKDRRPGRHAPDPNQDRSPPEKRREIVAGHVVVVHGDPRGPEGDRRHPDRPCHEHPRRARPRHQDARGGHCERRERQPRPDHRARLMPPEGDARRERQREQRDLLAAPPGSRRRGGSLIGNRGRARHGGRHHDDHRRPPATPPQPQAHRSRARQSPITQRRPMTR